MRLRRESELWYLLGQRILGVTVRLALSVIDGNGLAVTTAMTDEGMLVLLVWWMVAVAAVQPRHY